MTDPVKLSRERWEMLRASWEWPIIGMYSDGSRFINVLEPRETCGITFLPATYVPDDSDLKDWQRFPATALPCARA